MPATLSPYRRMCNQIICVNSYILFAIDIFSSIMRHLRQWLLDNMLIATEHCEEPNHEKPKTSTIPALRR